LAGNRQLVGGKISTLKTSQSEHWWATCGKIPK